MEKQIRDFKCPHCGGYLKVNNKIILLFEHKEGFDKNNTGLVLLDPTPGKYESIIHEKNRPNSGDLLKIICPMCYVNLDSLVKEGLCEIDVVTEEGLTGKLFFAPNMGDHATFVVLDEEEKKLQVFGKDAMAFHCQFIGYESHEMNAEDFETARTTHM